MEREEDRVREESGADIGEGEMLRLAGAKLHDFKAAR